MIIQLPDGKTAYFPDDTPPETIEGALREQFPAGGASPEQVTTQPIDAGPDGVPEGMFFDPRSQQYTSEEHIQNDLRMREGTEHERTATDAAKSGFAGGATLQWGDEAVGALTDAPTEAIRAIQAYDREKHPWIYGGSELIGAAGTSAPAGAAGVGRGLIGTALRSMGIGGLEGLVWGAGRGEKGNRTNPAITDALIGGGLGLGLPFAGAGIKKTLAPFSGVFAGGKARPKMVRENITDAVTRSGRTPEQISAAMRQAVDEGQPEYVLMDALGDPGVRKANAVARQPGEGSTEIRKFLEDRQLSQPERVSSFAEDAYGTNRASGTAVIPRTQDAAQDGMTAASGTAARRKEVLDANRRLAADAQYEAARQGAEAVDVRGALGVIDDYIAPLKDVDITDNNLAGTLQKFRERLAVDEKNLPPDVTSMELSNFDRILRVKQDVQQAFMKAKGYDRKKLGELMGALDEALEGASEGYRRANDEFARASRNIDAVDIGSEMARKGRGEDNVSRYQRMTPEQQGEARRGYADTFIERSDRKATPTTNRAKDWTSPKVTRERAAMVDDGGRFDRQLQREMDMWETQNRALQGSQTANNAMDVADLSKRQRLLSALFEVAHGRPGSGATRAFDVIAPALTGQNEATRTQVARLLMSGADPRTLLEDALRQDMAARVNGGITNALLRRAALTASSSAAAQ